MLEWLKTIIENATVTDGVLDAEALQEEIEKEFPKHAVPKSDFNDLSKKLKTANDTIKTLEQGNTDNETLQDEIATYKDTIKTLEKSNADARKEFALIDQLRTAGAVDPEYLIYKQGGLEKFTFDKDGKPVGIDDILKPIKEASPHLFKVDQQSGYNPKGGGKPPVVNPFAKDTWNLTKQGEIFRSNPTQAAELAAAAGVKI